MKLFFNPTERLLKVLPSYYPQVQLSYEGLWMWILPVAWILMSLRGLIVSEIGENTLNGMVDTQNTIKQLKSYLLDCNPITQLDFAKN